MSYFIFDNIDTRNYQNIEVYFDEVDTTPKRVYETVEVAGRNGSLYIDQGRYEDVPHTYHIVALTKDAGSNLINALASKIGYYRLEDSFNPTEYYSAVFTPTVEPKISSTRDVNTFKITFTRKPQRWLKSGEDKIQNGDVYATGDRTHSVHIVDYNGNTEIESVTVSFMPVFVGGSNTPTNPSTPGVYTTAGVNRSSDPSFPSGQYVAFTADWSADRLVYGGYVTFGSQSCTLTYTYQDVKISSLSWTYYSSGTTAHFYADRNIKKRGQSNVWCGAYNTYTGGEKRDFEIWGTSQNTYIYIRDSRFTDVESFVAAMGDTKIIYERSSPTSPITLDTSTTISVVDGDNYFRPFASYGSNETPSMEIVYRQSPALITNPTNFESSPLVEINGYGTIGFNGYEIELDNAVMGDIVLDEPRTTNSQLLMKYFDRVLLNNGDTITLNGGSIVGFFNQTCTPTVSFSIVSATNSDSRFSTSLERIDPSNPYMSYYITTSFEGIQFTAGTSSTITNETTLTVNHNGTTETLVFPVTVKYTAYALSSSSYIEVRGGYVNFTNYSYSTSRQSWNGITAYSTVSLLGNPTYVDCDLGEAYMIKNGSYVSLNQYIDLGSDLPKLASGTNEITFDNTITSLDITPRWWKL